MLKAALSDYQDYESRTWYDVLDPETLIITPYALTSDNRILDPDGAPMTDSDPETVAVRNAIESAVSIIDTLDEYQLVYGANGYSVVRYTGNGGKYYAFAGWTEEEARATDSRILENPVVKVCDAELVDSQKTNHQQTQPAICQSCKGTGFDHSYGYMRTVESCVDCGGTGKAGEE